MDNCLSCGNELTQVLGGREKRFCDSSCRYNFWRKKKVAEKKNQEIKESLPEYEAIKLNPEAVKLWEQLKTMLGSPAQEQKKLDAVKDVFMGKKQTFNFSEKEEAEEEEAVLYYNDYLKLIGKADSIDRCMEISNMVAKSNLAVWQKNILTKASITRSQHPDLN